MGDAMSDDDAEIDWTDRGTPRAVRFNDVYYSDEDGRAEARHVFLTGNGLPDRWRDVDRFAIGELGFGVGLNFFETCSLWRASGAVSQLDYVSFEKFPVDGDAIRRAISRWTELTPYAEALLAASGWPPPPGWSRVKLGQVSLTLAVGDANTLLDAWAPAPAPQRIDAWFFDGFSPARNPELWGADLMRAVGRRTAPGGTAASYTAAGWVRRNLEAAGFVVEKTPGFGSKREMITARRG